MNRLFFVLVEHRDAIISAIMQQAEETYEEYVQKVFLWMVDLLSKNGFNVNRLRYSGKTPKSYLDAAFKKLLKIPAHEKKMREHFHRKDDAEEVASEFLFLIAFSDLIG